MSWSLLICEGGHDQEFLCCLATAEGSWKHERKLPEGVPPAFGAERYLFFTRDAGNLVVARLDGINNILGERGYDLVKVAGSSAKTVGVILDADEVGVGARTEAVRRHFGPVLAAAGVAVPGQIVAAPGGGDSRRFGLWVAPDCASNGQLDEVMRQAANSLHPQLTPIAERFVSDLGAAAPQHEWRQYRQKAVLGSLGQRCRAGASLASALQERCKWVTPELARQEPFSAILRFMADVVA